MGAKIIGILSAAVTILSCAVFCIVEAGNTLNEPLFYHHYITFNVQKAYEQSLSGEKIPLSQLSPGMNDGSWFAVAAAVNTRQSLSINEAEADLGELGAYPLKRLGPLSKWPFDNDIHNIETQADPITDPRFRIDGAAFTFYPEDLELLCEHLGRKGPVTIERLTLRYEYNGEDYTKEIPIGKITFSAADSQISRLTGSGSEPYDAGGAVEHADCYRESGWAFDTLPGCTISRVSLPYQEDYAEFLRLGGAEELHSSALTEFPSDPPPFFTINDYGSCGLYYVQVYFQVEGTDAGGQPVSTFSTRLMAAYSEYPESVRNELNLQRKGGTG